MSINEEPCRQLVFMRSNLFQSDFVEVAPMVETVLGNNEDMVLSSGYLLLTGVADRTQRPARSGTTAPQSEPQARVP